MVGLLVHPRICEEQAWGLALAGTGQHELSHGKESDFGTAAGDEVNNNSTSQL